jgi:hypothetical protein
MTPGPAGQAVSGSTGAIHKQSAQSWATSQHEVAAGVPQKSKGPMIALAAIGALVVVGGGAFAGFKMMGNSSTETTQAVVTPAPEPAKAAAPQPPKVPVDSPPPPPAEVKAADTKPAETAASATPPQPNVHPAPPVAAAPVGKGRPIVAQPAPRPAPQPAKAPSKAPGSGTPDFGY